MESVASLSNKISSIIQEFSGVSNALGDIRIKLEKLSQLVSSGEVSSQTAESLKREYVSQLIELLDRYFRLRAGLEDLRVRCMVERERVKVEMAGASGSLDKASRLEELMFRIDDALESLDIDSRLFIASQYAQHLRSSNLDQDVLKARKLTYRRFVDSIVEDWLIEKTDLESELSDLEKKANSLRESLKELWVRFMVGEYDRGEYNSKRVRLEEELTSLESRIVKLRNRLESIDEKIIELTNVVRVEEVEGTLS